MENVDPLTNVDTVRPFVLPYLPRQEFPTPPTTPIRKRIPADGFSQDPDRTTRRESEYL